MLSTARNTHSVSLFSLLGILWAVSIGNAQILTPLIEAESQKANTFFDRVFDEALDRHPEHQTYLGIKKDYGEWDDYSEEANFRELEITIQNLRELEGTIKYELLDSQTKVSYRMAKKGYEDQIRNFKYRHYNYPVNQMFGTHTSIPSFLINQHLITNLTDAEAYISRLTKVDQILEQLIVNLKIREEVGIVPPRFVFPRAQESCRNIISGIPFSDTGKDSALLADFKKKVNALDLKDSLHEGLIRLASDALLKDLQPAYESLIEFLVNQNKRANDDAGVWKFDKGAAYYNEVLRLTTTTALTADQIHRIGLTEVDRIHGEMRMIMKQVGFKGALQDFFEFMRTDEQFYYPNTDEGREAYLERAVAVIDDMRDRLDTLFITKPEADIIVKRVEAFREKSAGTAFYQRPAPDGTRPGTYYANLYNMKNMPKYQLEALAYHEGIPGHHMQLALSIESEGLPKFRKFGGQTAYIEGWGLYCEQIPKELGLYTDPYSDFGRLAMELWRACRLVVDTGIHAKRWTREKGIEYYKTNTPDSERDCVRMVERHIVMAGQATAYKIGMLKILELREKARNLMGDDFDIRQFHEVVLSNGAVPLDILEELIDDYITSE
ncbi:MAG: DUF885 domain-containing protein [Verrucomicrobia bacterium]|nr:DUF885 domain-containing protein [Verrucomicrobiota bacterium]